MIDLDTRGSPGWWLSTLATQLHDRRQGRSGTRQWSREQVASSRVRPPLTLLEDYRRGDPPLSPDIHSGWAEAFRRYVRISRLNVAGLLVRSTTNRMRLRDFRTAAAQDEQGDAEARRIMRANRGALLAREVHDDMCGLGDSYVMGTPPAGGRTHTLLTSESPLQCITAHDPATGETLAGLKMFRDDWDAGDWAYLHLPGRLWVARNPSVRTTLFGESQLRMVGRQWSWDEARSVDLPGDGRVPIVRFSNRDGRSEFEGHIDHLDRINDKLFNEWWITKIQAFRQRAVKGLPDRDEKGNLVDYSKMFVSSPDALWQLPEGAEIWESTPVDTGALVNSVQKELQWLAAAASKPLHTITPDAANGSAEGASLMREEHVSEVDDRIDRASASWSPVMSMAFLYQGDVARSDVTQIEPMWAPVERYSLSERSEAARALTGILPREVIWTDVLQYPPGEVANLRLLAGRDLLYQGDVQPVP